MDDGYYQTQNTMQQRSPVMYHEQIDQMIITPESNTTQIVKKIPRIVRKPVFSLDDLGQKIPVLDQNGYEVFDEKGQKVYKIERFEDVQEGFMAKAEYIPATELLYVDYATSNLSYDACSQLTRNGLQYNRILYKQAKTNQDYSNYLHKIRNDNLVILNSWKSYNGGTIQAIKTFINKTDEKQWIRPLDENTQKKGLFGMFGGKQKEEPEKKYTGFQQ